MIDFRNAGPQTLVERLTPLPRADRTVDTFIASKAATVSFRT